MDPAGDTGCAFIIFDFSIAFNDSDFISFCVKNKRAATFIFQVGTKVEISLEEEIFRDVWFPATIVEDLKNNLFLVEYNCSRINDESGLQRVKIDRFHIRPAVPKTRVLNFVLLEKVDALDGFGWWSGVITKKLADSRYSVYFKHMNKVKEFSHLDLRPHVEWKDEKWSPAYQVSVSNDGEHDEPRETVSLNFRNPIEDAVTGSNDKLVEAYKKSKASIASHDPSISNGGQSIEASSPSGDQTIDRTKKLFHENVTQEKSVELKRPMITFARKKAKLSADARVLKALLKVAGDSTPTSSPKTVKEKRVTKSFPIPIVMALQSNSMSVSRSKKSKPLTSISPQNTGQPETPRPLAPKIANYQVKVTDGESMTKRKRGRPFKNQSKKLKTSLAFKHQNGDANLKELPDGSGSRLTLKQERHDKLATRKHAKRRMMSLNNGSSPQDLQEETLCTMPDDQPLSKWFLPSLEPAGKTPPGNDRKATFVKRSSLWGAIESMEAFHVIPQNPHFRPLDNLTESERERHAIYKMVDFSRVYEDMSRLRFDNPRTEIEERLETLLELETHGFKVGYIRTRLMEMLSFKEKSEGIEARSNESKSDLGYERVKVQEHNKEIESIDNRVNELLEKRDRLLKEKETSEARVIGLERKAGEFEKANRECRHEFEALANARF